MADNKQLRDQLEDLFSDLHIPEPQASPEVAPQRDEESLAIPREDRPEPDEVVAEVPLDARPIEPEPLTQEPLHRPTEPKVQFEPEQGELASQTFIRRTWSHWQSKLGRKLTVGFLIAAVIPALILSIFGILSQVSSIRSNVTSNLELLAAQQETQIEQWIQSQRAAISTLAHEPSLVRLIRTLLMTDQNESEEQTTRLTVNASLSTFQVQHPVFDEVFLLNADGRVVNSTATSHTDKLESDAPYFVQGLKESYFGPPLYIERLDKLSLAIAEPLRYISGETIGVLVGLVDPEPLSQFMQTAPSLGRTGETFLVDAGGVLITSLSGNGKPAPGSLLESFGIERASAGDSGRGIYQSYDGKSVLGVFRWLPKMQMGLLAERQSSDAFRPIFVAIGGTLAVTVLAIALTALLGGQMAKRIVRPIAEMTESARQMIAGDLNVSVATNRSDEIGALGHAFNHMAERLRATIGSLEQTVAERTRQLELANYRLQKRTVHLEASAEVSRAAASTLDPRGLLQTTVDLIRERFQFNHVSFFLLDHTGEWAIAHAATGEVGRTLVAERYRLRVGGESIVGWVCRHFQPRIAPDVRPDDEHLDSALLPETRSEMALPLLAGGRLLGALDVQSAEEDAFDDEDVRTLQGLADLVAVALQNARVFAETRQLAQHQQLATRVLDRLQRASSVSEVFTFVLEELGETFDLAQATFRLNPEYPDEDGRDGLVRTKGWRE